MPEVQEENPSSKFLKLLHEGVNQVFFHSDETGWSEEQECIYGELALKIVRQIAQLIDPDMDTSDWLGTEQDMYEITSLFDQLEPAWLSARYLKHQQKIDPLLAKLNTLARQVETSSRREYDNLVIEGVLARQAEISTALDEIPDPERPDPDFPPRRPAGMMPIPDPAEQTQAPDEPIELEQLLKTA